MKYTKEFKASSELQSIGELWQSVASLAVGRVSDNEKYGGECPLTTRLAQAESLMHLANAILLTHEKMKEQNNDK